MVEFKQLKVTRDGKQLIADVAVKAGQWYDNVYVGGIMIDTMDNYLSAGPSSHSFNFELDTDEKRHRFVLDPSELGISNFDELYFVYAYTKGTPAPDIPCGKDVNMVLTPVYNPYPFYQNLMDYIKQLGASCCVPKGFIDALLKLKGLETACITGNYTDAILYFKKFFSKIKRYAGIRKGGCSCGKL
jgi:hypothetical protein